MNFSHYSQKDYRYGILPLPSWVGPFVGKPVCTGEPADEPIDEPGMEEFIEGTEATDDEPGTEEFIVGT